ncbi:nuclease domain-containing protein [Yersinia hibernica]|uniref:DUF1364 family protein n=1 Tax=Yersinia hibernica TaxID=2339259 RepID=A0ABX5QYR7_9GAMM|nr:nuclease domain-containing protein [Yersinia hibernica]QAX78397.1 DUF1364 family protein [Yersinia hibernica]
MKSPAFRSKALRDSARGQCCTLQIPSICNGNPETTVLCHLPSSTHGMGYKSDDYWAGEKEQTLLLALYKTIELWIKSGKAFNG